MNATNPIFLAATAVALMAGAAPCQCDLQWLPGDPIPFLWGPTDATALWDPDGAGPAPAALLVGGRNMTVGRHTQLGVAAWDGTDWTALEGIAEASALVVHQGELFAADGAAVYRRTGNGWHSVGALSANAEVKAMASFQGQLYVGGSFSSVQGMAALNIARWNGTSWSGVGGGTAGPVAALASHTFQNQPGLYVAHNLVSGSGTQGTLSAWNGASWSVVATAAGGPIHALAARLGSSAANTYLFAGGDFTSLGGVQGSNVVRYVPSTNAWTTVGNAPATTRLHVRNTGINGFDLFGCVGSAPRRWTGSTWAPIGAVNGEGTLAYFGGRYVTAFANGGVLEFDGTAWRRLYGAGIDGDVFAVVADGDDVVIGGGFRNISGVSMGGVARGTSNTWTPLGGGVTGASGVVQALLRLPNGDICAGGTFTIAGGGAGDHVVIWNGSAWQPLGAGPGGAVHALARLPDGRLVAAGDFPGRIASWDGSTWSTVGGGVVGQAYALLPLANGDLVVGGWFGVAGSTPANNIARWTGTAWQTFDVGVDDRVFTLAELPNGDIWAGGWFQNAGSVPVDCVACWNGSYWDWVSPPGGCIEVTSLSVHPDGDVVLGGNFTDYIGNTQVLEQLSVWDGSLWRSLRVRGGLTGKWRVSGTAVTASGDVVAVGDIWRAGTEVLGHVARLAPTCAATAVIQGAGCSGSNGPNALAWTSLPWLGTTCRARATGMPQVCLALAVYGFAPVAIPLSAVLPQGGTGCTLLATPDLLEPSVPANGVTETALAVPPTIGLVGLVVHHQVVALEFDLALQLLAVTSTNRLDLTIGTF